MTRVIVASGEGFEYLACYAEKKTHTDFEALAQSQVLDPLKMADTAYTRRAWFDGRIALPTDSQGKVLQPQIADHWNAADLIYTTPTDYARFMLGVIRGDGLSSGIAAERIRIQVAEGSKSCASAKIAGCPDAQGFGLGWEIIKIGDEMFLMHTGHDEGAATFALIDLKRRSGTVIFTNSSDGFSVVPGILDLVGTDPKLLECLRRDAC